VKNEISKRNLRKKFRGNLIVETSSLKFSQPAASKTISGKIPRFPDEKTKTVAETSFDWNLIFPQNTGKKKNNNN
jgi:hypothetical protein